MNAIRHVIGRKITRALYRGRHRGTAAQLRSQGERAQLAELMHDMPELGALTLAG